jgi:hypothetical protein
MNDDRKFLEDRLAGYTDYSDPDTRVQNEERARAFAGEQLATIRERLGKSLDKATALALDAAILECQFADMEYARTLQDARLDDTTIAALVQIDRRLVEAAEGAAKVSAGELRPLLEEIAASFKARQPAIAPVAAARASG